MKNIDTLVSDIQDTLQKGVENVPDELLEKYGGLFVDLLKTRLRPSPEVNRGTLRMSNVGKPCERQLYYSVNNPKEEEELRPEAKMKFLFGDLIEILLLFLTEVSGHSVTGSQDTVEIEGIKGHRDAVIDGVIVDVKSASTYSFKKFQEHNLINDDPFGYRNQLQSYMYSSSDDPLVTDKSRGAFLVVDKTLGHICLDIHPKDNIPYPEIYKHKIEMVSSETPPDREFLPIPEGKSGNTKLPMNCSYCGYKKKCYPSMRTFLYSSGPVHLIDVKREPNVQEIT